MLPHRIADRGMSRRFPTGFVGGALGETPSAIRLSSANRVERTCAQGNACAVCYTGRMDDLNETTQSKRPLDEGLLAFDGAPAPADASASDDAPAPGDGAAASDAALGMPDAGGVERLTGVAIEYYMLTTFTSFEALIDALGGVTVDVPKNVTVPDPMTAENVSLKAGRSQSLDGSEALVLARARKEYGEHQEALRQMNVRNIETAMIQKVLSLDSDKNANAVLVDLEEYTDTNLDMASVGYLLVDFIANREEVTIYSTTGPYAGGENAEGLWVVQEDPAAWAELMAVVDAGEDPEGIVKLPSHS